MALTDINRRAVERAVHEFDALSRDKFLKKYNKGASRGYYLAINRIRYNAMAIVLPCASSNST